MFSKLLKLVRSCKHLSSACFQPLATYSFNAVRIFFDLLKTKMSIWHCGYKKSVLVIHVCVLQKLLPTFVASLCGFLSMCIKYDGKRNTFLKFSVSIFTFFWFAHIFFKAYCLTTFKHQSEFCFPKAEWFYIKSF